MTEPDYERRVREERNYRSSWSPPSFPDREARAEEVIRSHGDHIQRQAAELEALRAQVQRVREFLERAEKRNTAWIPVQALRWVLERERPR